MVPRLHSKQIIGAMIARAVTKQEPVSTHDHCVSRVWIPGMTGGLIGTYRAMSKHIGLNGGAIRLEFWRAHQLDPWHVRVQEGVPPNIDVMSGRSALRTGPLWGGWASSAVHVEQLLRVVKLEFPVRAVSGPTVSVSGGGQEVH